MLFSLQYVLVSRTGLYKAWERGRHEEKFFFWGGGNTCGSSALNMLYITLQTPRICRYLLDFWKICASSDLESVFFAL